MYKQGDKIRLVPVRIEKESSYVNYAYSYYGTTVTVYVMRDADENCLVWKTSATMAVTEGNDTYYPKKGDSIVISATVKELSQYNGVSQTVLTRVKVNAVTEKAPTWEEIKMSKQEEQRNTLSGEDFIWIMPYKQYKEHYADCEKLFGSYKEADQYNRTPTIGVIIREGRLKNSGVRGKHYSGFCFENEKHEKITYRAVCEENAQRRVEKDFPEHTWDCVKIYTYDSF